MQELQNPLTQALDLWQHPFLTFNQCHYDAHNCNPDNYQHLGPGLVILFVAQVQKKNVGTFIILLSIIKIRAT